MFEWKKLIFIAILIMVFDMLWLRLSSESVYLPILTQIQGQPPNLGARWPAALICWILMAIGIQFYVLDQSTNLTEILKNGFLFGLIVYGIYNLTTYITFTQYNLTTSAIDTTWGIILCMIVSTLTFVILK
jgi:uncharacterized membrane protein